MHQTKVLDETAQQDVASFLTKWQTEVRSQIPVGPSRLVLDPKVLNDCGVLGSAMVVVRDIMAENERIFLAKSGNVPLSGAYDEIRKSEVQPKYLNATASVSQRKKLVEARTTQRNSQRSPDRTQKKSNNNNNDETDEFGDDFGVMDDDMDMATLHLESKNAVGKKQGTGKGKGDKTKTRKKTKKILSAAERDKNAEILRRIEVRIGIGFGFGFGFGPGPGSGSVFVFVWWC